MGFNPKRIERNYTQKIDASPGVVFSLLCPVREQEWLDGWDYAMVYSESGLVELGAVFTTPNDGEPDTLWVVTKHDPSEREVGFVRVTAGSCISLLNVSVRPRGADGSFVDVKYTYTGLTPKGNEFIEHFTQEAFLQKVTHWERSMNHYLKTSEKLLEQEKTS